MKMKRSLPHVRYGRHPADAFSDNVAERKSRANGICAVSSGCTEMSSCCGSVVAFFRASRGQEQHGGETNGLFLGIPVLAGKITSEERAKVY